MKSRDKENIIGISVKELDTPIYRFTTVERILQLIADHKNTLVSPRKWEDPFENLLARLTIRQSNGEKIQHPIEIWSMLSVGHLLKRLMLPGGFMFPMQMALD